MSSAESISGDLDDELRSLANKRLDELRASSLAYARDSKFYERCVLWISFSPILAGLLLITPNIVAMVGDDDNVRDAVLLTNAVASVLEAVLVAVSSKVGVAERAKSMGDAAREFRYLIHHTEINMATDSGNMKSILERLEEETRRILETAPLVPQLGGDDGSKEAIPDTTSDSASEYSLSTDPWIAFQQKRMSQNALYASNV